MTLARRQFLQMIASTAAAPLTIARPISAEEAARPVRTATGLLATWQSTAWLGAELGVFKKHGIDMSLPAIAVGGPQAATHQAPNRESWLITLDGCPFWVVVKSGHASHLDQCLFCPQERRHGVRARCLQAFLPAAFRVMRRNRLIVRCKTHFRTRNRTLDRRHFKRRVYPAVLPGSPAPTRARAQQPYSMSGVDREAKVSAPLRPWLLSAGTASAVQPESEISRPVRPLRAFRIFGAGSLRLSRRHL
jgi:hypothetical protein